MNMSMRTKSLANGFVTLGRRSGGRQTAAFVGRDYLVGGALPETVSKELADFFQGAQLGSQRPHCSMARTTAAFVCWT
jgi:hypothetical protein